MDKNIINSIKKDEVYAIIPARSGSKGVKNKNIKLLCGYPMIAYSIIAAKLSPAINRVIVTTDSPDYAKLANKYGAETPFLRPAEISQDYSTDLEFMEHCINWLYENEKSVPEYFVHLRPTTPLRQLEYIEKAISEIKKDENSTSLRSAHISTHPPFKWFKMSEDGYFRSILGVTTNDEANNPRQKFENVYIPDGYVDVLKTEFIVKNDLIHGQNIVPFIVPEIVDIDAKKDIELLEYFIQKYNSEIFKYLTENFEKETIQ